MLKIQWDPLSCRTLEVPDECLNLSGFYQTLTPVEGIFIASHLPQGCGGKGGSIQTSQLARYSWDAKIKEPALRPPTRKQTTI